MKNYDEFRNYADDFFKGRQDFFGENYKKPKPTLDCPKCHGVGSVRTGILFMPYTKCPCCKGSGEQ